MFRMCKNLICSAQPGWVEVFRTGSGCVYQSDAEKVLFVEFGGKIARYDIRCLNRLKKAVANVDLVQMSTDVQRTSDVEIISLCACEHCYALDISQIIAFRELLEGAFVMFDLNSIIQERLYSLPAFA